MGELATQWQEGLKDFIKFRDGWFDFYTKLGIDECLHIDGAFRWERFVNLSKIDPSLMVLILPPAENQGRYIAALKTACETLMGHIWISPHTVRRDLTHGSDDPQDMEDFLTNLDFSDRPDVPYILTADDCEGFPEETRAEANRSVKPGTELIEMFSESGKVGLNLFEYLVFRYAYFLKHKTQLSSQGACWLFGSLLSDNHALVASEQPESKLKVWSWPLNYRQHNSQGARCGMVTPLG